MKRRVVRLEASLNSMCCFFNVQNVWIMKKRVKMWYIKERNIFGNTLLWFCFQLLLHIQRIYILPYISKKYDDPNYILRQFLSSCITFFIHYYPVFFDFAFQLVFLNLCFRLKWCWNQDKGSFNNLFKVAFSFTESFMMWSPQYPISEDSKPIKLSCFCWLVKSPESSSSERAFKLCVLRFSGSWKNPKPRKIRLPGRFSPAILCSDRLSLTL